MTELRNFDLNLLLAFKLLLDERSVSRAAQKLFVSQPAMSHILQRLRQQLDDPILLKTATGMKPTERALALLEPINSVLNEVEQILRIPEEFSPLASQRRFVIATSDYIEFTLMPSLVESLDAKAPNVELLVKQTNSRLLEAEIDEKLTDLVVGFDVILNPPSTLCRETIFADEITCVVRRDHPDLSGDRISLEQFMAARHMVIWGAGTSPIDEWLEKEGLTRKISLTVPNFLSAPLIVASTDLVLSLPKRIAEQFARMAPLKILPMPIAMPTFDLIMIWHPLQEKDPANKWLREEIRRASRGLANP